MDDLLMTALGWLVVVGVATFIGYALEMSGCRRARAALWVIIIIGTALAVALPGWLR